MQKWEYLYLITLNKKDYSINGKKYTYEKDEDAFTIVNKLGADGWELVAEPQIGVHTFKRPIE